VALFNLGVDKTSRLLLVIHHLVVDGVSWRILVEDLQNLPATGAREAIKLPSKTTSFKQWSEQLRGMRQRWCSKSWTTGWQNPVNMFPICQWTILGANTVASARIMSVTLSVAETKVLLQEVPAAYHTQINDVLLTAGTTFAQWTGERSLLVNLEGHGGRKF